MGFPGDSVVKNLCASAGVERDIGLIPGLGRSPGVGNNNWENFMDRGAWQTTVHRIAESDTIEHTDLEYFVHSMNCQSGGLIQNTSSVDNSSETAQSSNCSGFIFLVSFLDLTQCLVHS